MKFLLSLCILVVATMAEESEVLKSFAKGNSEFSSKFYQEIIKDKQGENIISSPFSAQTILALTTLGTNGNTFTELTQSLHLPADKEGIKAVYQTLTPKLAGNGEYTLNSANKIYIKKDFEVKKDYKEIATGVFQSDIENIEFEKSAEAADTINKWVESKTNNNIHNLIKPDSLDALTRLVLVNALHFKGNWSHRFEKYATQDKEFFKTEKDVVKVPTMFQTATLKYHECGFLNAKFVELPYEGGDVSMVLIVPNEKEGLAEVEKKGGADLLKYSEEKFKYERIALSMPKFKIETELPLVPTLKNLGVKSVFDAQQADLKGISDAPLYVSDVIQKAFIEVDEDGTEASAATAVKMVLYSLPTMRQPDPIPVKVDRPFVYYLKINDAVIFSGRVITPTTA